MQRSTRKLLPIVLLLAGIARSGRGAARTLSPRRQRSATLARIGVLTLFRVQL